jgi:hypothetical protein
MLKISKLLSRNLCNLLVIVVYNTLIVMLLIYLLAIIFNSSINGSLLIIYGVAIGGLSIVFMAVSEMSNQYLKGYICILLMITGICFLFL